ncbi:MAG: tRNA (N6-isopentenyl adenosine(37)-C2)-methylthiotransferase MiaB [Parcubacteria group bacterium]
MPSYFIITFGCQMNKSDSERIAAVFESLGFAQARTAESADFVVVNACAVRQTAVDRAWGLVRNKKTRKQKNKKLKKQKIKNQKFILTGCILDKDKVKFEKKFDFIFNIKELGKLAGFLRGNAESEFADYFAIKPKITNKFQAFVPIMTGCDNYCSYCVVPYVRGREASRPVKDVLNEIKRLVKAGGKEILILGQNVNSYNPNDEHIPRRSSGRVFCSDNPFKNKFAKLLWEANQIDGINRIIFAASHPKDMNHDIISALALPKMMNYLHLALQSGDDEVLAKMNRQYTTDDYYAIIKKVRKIKPEIAIGTDLIVGFPGETKRQFENTLKFYDKIKFDIAFISKYSPRAGTASAKMEDEVPQAEKQRRWREVQNLMEKMVLKLNRKYVGKTMEVLIDGIFKEKDGRIYSEGNSREMKRVRIYSKLKAGDIVNVEIIEAKEWILIGKIV